MLTISVEVVISCVIFFLEKPQIQETTMARVPYDKLLFNQACPSHTEEYCTLVIFVWTLLHSIFSSTMFNQYSPVWPSYLVSKSFKIFPSCYLYFGLLGPSMHSMSLKNTHLLLNEFLCFVN